MSEKNKRVGRENATLLPLWILLKISYFTKYTSSTLARDALKQLLVVFIIIMFMKGLKKSQ